LLSLLRLCSLNALWTGMAINSDTTSNEIIISSSSMVVLISLLVKSVDYVIIIVIVIVIVNHCPCSYIRRIVYMI
jgi:hypothetical protein